jgi:PleD family two-component response regulator
MREQMELLRIGARDESILFSGGYVYGTPRLQSDLRLMMRQADDNLYKAKREGKDVVVGSAFDRVAAQALVGNDQSVRLGVRLA